MKIVLVLDYHDVERLAKLFSMLHERFPTGWVSFEYWGTIKPEIHPYLLLSSYEGELKPEDRAFLNSLKAPFLTGPNPEPRHDVLLGWELVEQP